MTETLAPGIALHHGDCLDVLRELEDASVDAVVCDPPYAINFMGRNWDSFKDQTVGACEECGNDDPCEGYRLCSDCLEASDEADLRAASMLGQQSQNWHEKATHSRGFADNNNAAFQRWCLLWSSECLRVLKPGGHMLAFGGTRTWHRLACAVEDSGFEVRDSIAWLHGQGFPKSLEVSKAIDKAAGADREVIGAQPDRWTGKGGVLNFATDRPQDEIPVTGGPATPEAEPWQGWGTALKPAFEPIVVGRKPLTGTVAANVLEHGTGALNIDACRIETDDDLNGGAYAEVGGRSESASLHAGSGMNVPGKTVGKDFVAPAGRWPANVILDESQAEVLDEQSGILQSGANPTRRSSDKFRDAYGDFAGQEECTPARGVDSGGASRFFYVAKASSDERVRVDDVAHPTVKPLALMRWLVRLVTPPGGTVLDPFAGSGTTGEACLLEGFDCVLIEREPTYLPLIRQRIARRRDPVTAVRAVSADDAGLFDLLDEETHA